MNDHETTTSRSRLLLALSVLLGVLIALGALAPLRFHGLEVLILWMGLFFLFVITALAAVIVWRRSLNGR